MHANAMTRPGDSVLIGVSGGADSLALLCFLNSHKQELGISIGCAHLNHGIREEAEHDCETVKKLCRKLDVPFYSGKTDVALYARETSLTLEEAGRELRYRYFGVLCRQHGFNRLALAHHLDDQAETILFRLARGTGLKGACGILPVTRHSDITMIRPFLDVRKNEILEWFKNWHIDFCEDSTNADLYYSRNRIRSQVLPSLEEACPGAGRNIGRFAENLQDTRELLEEVLEPEIRKYIRVAEDGVLVEKAAFTDKSSMTRLRGFRAELLRTACREAGIRKDLSRQHVQAILDLFESGKAGEISLPRGFKAYSESGRFSIRQPDDRTALETLELEVPEQWMNGYYREYQSNGGKIIVCDDIGAAAADQEDFRREGRSKKGCRTVVDYDNITDSLNLRSRQSGDYIKIDGETRKKKLSRFFIDKKVPRTRRDRIPLLADGHEILWIPGLFKKRQTEKTDRKLNIILEGYEYE
ncbi:MAG: tRNA lysidine(34) synthetase TilS [Eubacteriaceae bacterium]